ncbi:hypothetical protein LCGC14_3035970 [marine sediment metagenome]|uniref:DNA methylase N-4/N-6 domain-containing protein n=1 Tax=marine sediment metagenome TaxID=412755 RepID=A0A0F8XE97_9ZZZZ
MNGVEGVENLVWILPDSRPEHYPGSWPLEFEERLLELYGFDFLDDLRKDVIQLFSGGVQYGFKVDLREDSHPDYHGDAHHLPIDWADRWKMCICDPPYTSNWSRVLYGMSHIIYSKYITEAVRIVQSGGFIASYHWSVTPTPDNCILHRRIFIGRDYFKKVRVCMVFQKR